MNYPYNFNFVPPTLSQNLIKVTGIEGAKAYQMSPNSVTALFDDKENIMYIKQTDGAGFPTIKTFTFTECETETETKPAEISEIRAEIDALREDMNKLKAEIKKPSKKEKTEE